MKLLALFIATSLLINCETLVKPRVVWSDEFNYKGTPDTTKWTYDLGDGCPNVCGWGNHELEYYTNDLNNVRVENGNLIIEARKENKDGKQYTSSRILSRKKGDWTYGRFEIRAKLPKGLGTWPAIWMLSTDWKYGGWPESGEVDIMEHVGYDPGVIHGTIHTEAFNHRKQTQKEGKITIPDAQDAFHVYVVDWNKDQMRFYVDDKLYHTVDRNAGDTFKEWPFDQRFHLIMNIAVGGDWGGSKGVDENIWPQQMLIDYVRVYQ
jgi:beta-glucanase (GH16 family)